MSVPLSANIMLYLLPIWFKTSSIRSSVAVLYRNTALYNCGSAVAVYFQLF